MMNDAGFSLHHYRIHYMALKVNPMEQADPDGVQDLQDHIILTDIADLTVHTKKDIIVVGDIMMIVDMKNMIAVQDRDHQIVANTEERITDVKKNIMMNATNIENLRAEENDLLGRKPEEKEVLKKKEIKKEDLDIKKSLKNDVFFRENNLLHHFYISYYT